MCVSKKYFDSTNDLTIYLVEAIKSEGNERTTVQYVNVGVLERIQGFFTRLVRANN